MMAEFGQLLSSGECWAALGIGTALLYWLWPRRRTRLVRRVTRSRNGQAYWKERERY